MTSADSILSYRIKYLSHLCPENIHAGSTFKMRVEILNSSDLFLSSEGSIFSSYRWLDPATEERVSVPELWTKLEDPIGPGKEGVVYPLVKAPGEPGDYLLEFDFVHDSVAWFHQKSSELLRIPVRVLPRRIPGDLPLAQKYTKELSYFLIVGVQRSGTSVIHANLGNHPYIECLSSELRIDPLLGQGSDLFTNTPCEMPRELETGWREIYKTIASLNRTRRTVLCGGKIAVPDAFAALRLVVAIGSTFPELKIILIERKDKVAQFGSLKKAQETKLFCSTTKPSKVDKIVIDEGEFTACFHEYRRTNDTLRRLAETNPFYHCYYEDVAANPDQFIGDIYRFLGVRPMRFKNRIQKLLPPPQDYIVNHAEITKLFHELESMQQQN